MKTCIIQIKDEVNCKLIGVELGDRKALVNKFKYDIPGAKYTPAVRLGRWDGKVAYFQLSGSTYTNLLPDILVYLESQNYDVELDDQRTYSSNYSFEKIAEDSFANKVWPPKHPIAGQPVMLRDYQTELINNFLANPQSLQVIATGAGKCRTYDSLLSISVNQASDFGNFLLKLKTSSTLSIKITNLNIKIGEFCNAIEEYKEIHLLHNQEVNVEQLDCYVPTPTGQSRINYIIKKENMLGLTLLLDTGVEIKCATKHILSQYASDVYADELSVGDEIDTVAGPVRIKSINSLEDTTFYDIGIDSPHLYYDPDGVLHHNTLMTATLSLSVEQYGRSIVIVPNKSLVTQTEEDYVNLGLDVGVYYGDRKEFGHTHTICTWQSLNIMMKNTQSGDATVTITDFLEGVVCVIVDECHQAKAEALKTLLTGVMAHIPIRWGLSGTIPTEDFSFKALQCGIGNVVGQLSAKELQDAGHLSNCHINIVQLVDHAAFTDYQSELKYLTETAPRLAFVAQLVNKIRETGNTLILVDRIATGTKLQLELTTAFSALNEKPDIIFVSGSTKAKDRKDEYDQVADSTNKIIIATYGVAAVGINIIRLFNIVLFEPGKSFVRVIQSIGRGLRKGHDKEFVNIYDITSTCKFSKRHLTARKKFYADAKYEYTIEKLDWQK